MRNLLLLGQACKKQTWIQVWKEKKTKNNVSHDVFIYFFFCIYLSFFSFFCPPFYLHLLSPGTTTTTFFFVWVIFLSSMPCRLSLCFIHPHRSPYFCCCGTSRCRKQNVRTGVSGTLESPPFQNQRPQRAHQAAHSKRKSGSGASGSGVVRENKKKNRRALLLFVYMCFCVSIFLCVLLTSLA